MQLTMLECKQRRATVTACDLHYEGTLIEASGVLANERVETYNIDNGGRFIGAKAGSVVNASVARQHEPVLVLCGPGNVIEAKPARARRR